MKNGMYIEDFFPVNSSIYYPNSEVYYKDDEIYLVIDEDCKKWIKDGTYHRLDGPAIEWPDGYKDWYYEGKYIDVDTQQEFERYLNLIIFK